MYMYFTYPSVTADNYSTNLIGNSGAKGVGKNIDTLMKDQAVVMAPAGDMQHDELLLLCQKVKKEMQN